MSQKEGSGKKTSLFERYPLVEPQPGASYFSLEIAIGDQREKLILQEIPSEITEEYYEYLGAILQRQIDQGAFIAAIRASSVGVAVIKLAPGITVLKATRHYYEHRLDALGKNVLTREPDLEPERIHNFLQYNLPVGIPNLFIKGLTADDQPFEASLKYYPPEKEA